MMDTLFRFVPLAVAVFAGFGLGVIVARVIVWFDSDEQPW